MFRPQYLSLASLWFLLLTFAAGVAYALAYSSLVIFGDSLADSVNNATVIDTQIAPPGTPPGTVRTPTPIVTLTYISGLPYASDRYSNGAVSVEQFVAKLRLSATASLLGGNNRISA